MVKTRINKKKQRKSRKKIHGKGRDDEWTLVGDVAVRQSKGGFFSSGDYYITKVPLPPNMSLSDQQLLNGCKSNTLDYCGIVNPSLIGKDFSDVPELLFYIQKQIDLENVGRLYERGASLLKLSDFLPALKNGTFKKLVIDDHLAVSGELSAFNANLKASNYQNFTTI